MSSKAISGQTCAVCRSPLVETTANCPSCGKLDLHRLRLDVARAVAPIAVTAVVIFGFLAAATAYYNFPSLVSGLATSLDGQFKQPTSIKK